MKSTHHCIEGFEAGHNGRLVQAITQGAGAETKNEEEVVAGDIAFEVQAGCVHKHRECCPVVAHHRTLGSTAEKLAVILLATTSHGHHEKAPERMDHTAQESAAKTTHAHRHSVVYAPRLVLQIRQAD
jgi:hypothetical protein